MALYVTSLVCSEGDVCNTSAVVFGIIADANTAKDLRPFPCTSRDLPRVTSALHAGVGSDVDKVAEYRAFARMRRAFPQSYTSYEMGNFSRFLIKVSTAQIMQAYEISPQIHCGMAPLRHLSSSYGISLVSWEM